MSSPLQEETRPGVGRVPDSLAGGKTNKTQVTDPADEFPLADLATAVRLRRTAHDLGLIRRREQAREAVKRTRPPVMTAAEIEVQRETAILFARIVTLENAGKIRWSDYSDDWVKRPVFTRTDQTRPPVYSIDELLDRFQKVRRVGKRWTARCPAHEDKTPSLAIAAGTRGWLIKCWAGCDFADIVAAAGIETQRMFFT